MYKVKKDFADNLKDLYRYKVGDDYEEVSPVWTKYLVENGYIERVSIEKKRYEAVQKERD